MPVYEARVLHGGSRFSSLIVFSFLSVTAWHWKAKVGHVLYLWRTMCEHWRGKLSLRTGEVVVLLAVGVGKGDQLPQQQGVLEYPLHWFNQVGLQSGRVLLGGVPRIQEFFERLIGLSWREKSTRVKLVLIYQQFPIFVFVPSLHSKKHEAALLSSDININEGQCRIMVH